jgi:hypothetical protein
MKTVPMTRRTLVKLLVMSPALALGTAAQAKADGDGQVREEVATLLACGAEQIVTLSLRFRGAAAEILERRNWEAKTSQGLPSAMVPLFATMDDCKPIDGGSKVLVTSSAGGVAIIDRSTGDTEFYATVPDAHSAEVLPGNRLVVVSSNPDQRLVVFDRSTSGEELFSVPLASGHGAYWEETERTLWALGRRELHAYALTDWETSRPSIRLSGYVRELPSDNGHDLVSVPNSRVLIVTTVEQVLTFDPTTNEFAVYSGMGSERDVKSVSVHPTNGRVAFVKADPEEWWSQTIRFLDPPGQLTLPGDRFYKARWLA